MHCQVSHKLAFKYYGPFEILRKINHVAYELVLPHESRIHHVFHVSQLRQGLAPGTAASSTLPVPHSAELSPVELLDKCRWQTLAGLRE